MTDTFYVTTSEREAARGLIEIAERRGEPLEAEILAIANAELYPAEDERPHTSERSA